MYYSRWNFNGLPEVTTGKTLTQFWPLHRIKMPKKYLTSTVRTQLRGGQLPSEFRLIIRFSKTVHRMVMKILFFNYSNFVGLHIAVFMWNSPKRSARNVQFLRTMTSWCWWMFKHTEQQQQCFWLRSLDENGTGFIYPMTTQFHELRSQIYPQTVMKALLFSKFFLTTLEVSFQYFPNLFKRKASHFVNVKYKTNFLSIRECHYTFRTQNKR